MKKVIGVLSLLMTVTFLSACRDQAVTNQTKASKSEPAVTSEEKTGLEGVVISFINQRTLRVRNDTQKNYVFERGHYEYQDNGMWQEGESFDVMLQESYESFTSDSSTKSADSVYLSPHLEAESDNILRLSDSKSLTSHADSPVRLVFEISEKETTEEEPLIYVLEFGELEKE